jgi:hypothetical protein
MALCVKSSSRWLNTGDIRAWGAHGERKMTPTQEADQALGDNIHHTSVAREFG